jgi:hypothetical protein
MTVRTARLLGRAYSDAEPVTLSITWNDVDVWNGSVLTRAMDEQKFDLMTDQDCLCEWTFPIDVYGDVPICIRVTGGQLWWRAVWTNYAATSHRFYPKLHPTWTKHEPASTQEFMDDFGTLTYEEFADKYGFEAYDNIEQIVVTPAEDNFMGSINVLSAARIDNDGKNNVRIDGVPKSMDLALRSQGVMGDWLWRVNPGQMIQAEITVDPPRQDTFFGQPDSDQPDSDQSNSG